MTYDFSTLKTRIKETEEWLARELSGVRTGRATPTLLDAVKAEAYDTHTPLRELASVSVEDARTLRIIPWDMSLIKKIEKGITDANLGVGISSDDQGLRVSFPELTSERRTQLVKLAKEKVEEARTMLRSLRDDVWNDIQKQERDGKMPEDDKFRAKEDMQKRVDAANTKFDEALMRKEKEIAA